eukprot:CAMPEP_0116120504 /NCGR_PEP_ID=MMETSP0329-20121206/3208_1 /TAXON_ID=697910 /ORGANISM="Pseudo-nitzschia arenysensis, Strain B593" /LENGTH=249 /DNA_ID=CAMNT_0003614273 /DNA_START=101 /DNA_END=850 /DNA_ORIENTATION=+
MNSTIGKYGESIPTGASPLNGKSMDNIGETLFETPPRCKDENNESRNPTVMEESSTHVTPPRREVDEEELRRERLRREEEESLELARALMAEEAMASYSQSMDYLQNNQDQFSEEDLAALQAVMDEEQAQHELEVNAEAEEALDDEEGGDAYEFMLRLGERIGDVKTERWEQVAQLKINCLPLVQFDAEKVKCKTDLNDCDVKCLVCQEDYCKGEELRKLPCGHYFHKDCVDQWLLSKDFCPYCRTSIH